MIIKTPIPDYAAAREAMVDGQLRPQGVNNPAVLDAMADVAREQFVAPQARPFAYSDRSVPIGGGRSMSSPTVLGLLLTELAPEAGERALVVGCGTGYSLAVLDSLGVDAVGLEQDGELAERAREAGAGAEVVEGPLAQGWKAGAPYDLILIDGAVDQIPEAIVAQLGPDGRLGAIVAERGISKLVVGRRAGSGFGLHSLADAGAAALPGFDRPRGFSF